MFKGCSSLKSLPYISILNTFNVNDTIYIFTECSALESLPDISKWDTSNVNNISFFYFLNVLH